MYLVTHKLATKNYPWALWSCVIRGQQIFSHDTDDIFTHDSWICGWLEGNAFAGRIYPQITQEIQCCGWIHGKSSGKLVGKLEIFSNSLMMGNLWVICGWIPTNQCLCEIIVGSHQESCNGTYVSWFTFVI